MHQRAVSKLFVTLENAAFAHSIWFDWSGTHGNIESGNGKLVLTSIVEDLVNVPSGDDTDGNNVKNTHSVVVAISRQKKQMQKAMIIVSVACCIPVSKLFCLPKL